MRLSMFVGTALLLGAAAYVWFRGPDRRQEILEDVVDGDAAELVHSAFDDEELDELPELVPAFEG